MTAPAGREDRLAETIAGGAAHARLRTYIRSERMSPGELRIRPLSGIPRVRPGDDLAALLADALDRAGESLRDDDVVVVAQKIVSKAEGRAVRLAGVAPSPRATELAARTGKDPRAVEVILGESTEVLRAVPGVLIVETRHGIVLANAGADMSNIEHDEEDDHLLLLPEDPDASADRLRAGLANRAGPKSGRVGAEEGLPPPAAESPPPDGEGPPGAGGASASACGDSRPGSRAGGDPAPGGWGAAAGTDRKGLTSFGVIIADSVGRAWREGTVGLAIGVSGVPARLDRRGEPDLFGRLLHVTEVGIADAIASAASIVMGEGAEGRPAALVRGLSFDGRSEAERAGRARDLVRPRERDLFR